MQFMDVVETSSSVSRHNSAGLYRTAANNNFQSSSLVFPNATELRRTSSDDIVNFTPDPRHTSLPDVDDRNEATEILSRLGTSIGQSQRPSLARPMDLDPVPNSTSTSSCTMPCCQLQAPVGGPTDNMTTSGGGMLSQASKSGSRLVYTSERHPRCLLEAMNSLREKQELYDVVLLVDGRTIYTHRAVLAACSPYFRAMFTSELAESKQLEIPLYDLDGEAVETMISFCYTSQIAVEESNVQNLLPAACLLQLTEIQDVCCEFLKRQLDPTNCLGIRAFADTHACAGLLQAADRFVHANFLEVVESEEFLLLPFNQLEEILSSDELNTHTEEAVYLALMRWLHYQLPKRRRHLPHLLQFIRLPFLSPKFLVSTVGSDVLIRSDERCRDLVDEAKNYLLLPQERVSMQGPRTRPREALAGACGGGSGVSSGGGKELLFAVGGWCSGDAIASAEFYNPRSHEWHMVAPMQKRRCGVGVGVVNDLLYAVGGHDGQSYLNSVERYDPHTNQWSSDIAPTSTCRTSVGVAVLNGIMYAVGGQDGVSCLNMVERHDPVVNKWSKVASMSTSRLGVGVAVLNGQLYAVGGSDGRQPLSSVEQFDPRVGVWHRVTCMGTRRKHLGVAVYNNLIYAVGGRDEIMEASSAECFDPRNCSWSPVVALMSRRSGVGLTVVNNQLVAVGGFDGGTYLKTVEVYDREANCWRIRGCMNSRRLGGGVGVIRYANCSGVSAFGWAPDQSALPLHQRPTAYRLPWSETDEVGREIGSGAGSSCLVAGAHSQPIPPGLSTSLMPVRSATGTTSETSYHLSGLSQSMLIPGGGGTAADLTRVTSPGGRGSGSHFPHLRCAHTATASTATVSPPVTTVSPATAQPPPASSPTESTLTPTSRTETITPSLADTIGTSLSSDESLPNAVLF